MVVATKRDDKIVVGLSITDSVVDMSEKDLSLQENLPYWKVKGEKDCYVFCEDLCFASDLFRYNDYVFRGITDGNSIIRNVVPKMKELLDGYLQITSEGNWNTQLLIVKGDKIFTISRYFSVTEVDDFAGLNFEKIAIGCLEESKDMTQEESLLFASRTINRMKNRNIFPLIIFDSKTKKHKIYYK